MSRRPLAEPVLALAALFLLGGCASQAPVQLPAVGPVGAARVAPGVGDDAAMMGTLVVYSESLPVSRHRSSPSYPHTGYVIRHASGELVAQVDNNASSAESEPEEVPLKAGLYEVRARGVDVGTVLVPVVIAPGRRTELYLDATGMPAAQARTLTDPVRLADGRVVGARAVPVKE
jgi:hypothetical protein